MGLYRLNYSQADLSDGFMEKANKNSIDYERDFENWLENSPHVLFDEDASTVLWIGRQVSTTNDETTKYPDLLGIDANGDVVIVELKKGKTPREVVAQILEYAAWADQLTYNELNSLTMRYYEKSNEYCGYELKDIHRTVFYPETDQSIEQSFNNKLRLYIVAEEITKTIREVVKYLNTKGKINISCMKYDVYKSVSGEYFISTEIEEAPRVVQEFKGTYNRSSTSGWNGDVPVKQLVKRAVEDVLLDKIDDTFTAKEIIQYISKQIPECNHMTIRCQLTADCVNHTSRKHYKGGQQDLYFTTGNGKYRLYNCQTDGKWSAEGIQLRE